MSVRYENEVATIERLRRRNRSMIRGRVFDPAPDPHEWIPQATEAKDPAQAG